MKISNLEGITEIRLETTIGCTPIEVYEATVHDGILTLSVDIARDCARGTHHLSLEADERKARAAAEDHADLLASREFADDSEATLL
jgi:hypothetical protein